MNILVFLDFDGVLHAHSGPCSERFYYLPRFEAVVRNFPHAEIVISSSWALEQDLDTLRSHFAADIRSRVIGTLKFTEEQARTSYGRRHRIAAAQRFIEAHGLSERPWVALDDVASFWQPGAPLIICHDGFQEIEEQLLRMVLSGELPAKPSAIAFMDDMVRLYFRGDAKRALRFFSKYYVEHECLDVQWFDSVCATDPEFVDLLTRDAAEDDQP